MVIEDKIYGDKSFIIPLKGLSFCIEDSVGDNLGYFETPMSGGIDWR